MYDVCVDVHCSHVALYHTCIGLVFYNHKNYIQIVKIGLKSKIPQAHIIIILTKNILSCRI